MNTLIFFLSYVVIQSQTKFIRFAMKIMAQIQNVYVLYKM